MLRLRFLLVVLLPLALLACGTPAPRSTTPAEPGIASRRAATLAGSDIALYALALMDTGYRFGGKNPEAGLDCSGMVSHVYTRAAGIPLAGSAADIARSGRSVERADLRPGDLVFFNTRQKPFSHVGIYIGDQRFVHAPSTTGRVRIDRLDSRYYAQRFEAARTFFD